MKIFIDAGHNNSGADTGAAGNGLLEQDVTFAVAQGLAERLAGYGFEVKRSRERQTDNLGTSVAESINRRCAMANDWGADLFVSLHCNSASDPAANGAETLIFKSGTEAERLAGFVGGALAAIGLRDRGVKVRSDLGVLKNTKMTAMLVETAFISNVSDAVFLKNCQNELAGAVCRGICEYCGVGGHWAEKYFDFLTEKGIAISERRFDQPVTRGEAFRLLALTQGFAE